jgi:hypothetical protein
LPQEVVELRGGIESVGVDRGLGNSW